MEKDNYAQKNTRALLQGLKDEIDRANAAGKPNPWLVTIYNTKLKKYKELYGNNEKNS